MCVFNKNLLTLFFFFFFLTNAPSCDAVWEVALENGRHKVTLRSALQIVNKCGSWLEVRCSTDPFASVRERSSSREQVVGKVSRTR